MSRYAQRTVEIPSVPGARIQLILMGGTILSGDNDGLGVRSTRKVSTEIAALLSECQVHILFEGLSEDLTQAHLFLLADRIRMDCDRCIVLHGTDTVLNTANFLDLLTTKTTKVVFASCQRAPASPASDAIPVLQASLNLPLEQRISLIVGRRLDSGRLVYQAVPPDFVVKSDTYGRDTFKVRYPGKSLLQRPSGERVPCSIIWPLEATHVPPGRVVLIGSGLGNLAAPLVHQLKGRHDVFVTTSCSTGFVRPSLYTAKLPLARFAKNQNIARLFWFASYATEEQMRAATEGLQEIQVPVLRRRLSPPPKGTFLVGIELHRCISPKRLFAPWSPGHGGHYVAELPGRLDDFTPRNTFTYVGEMPFDAYSLDQAPPVLNLDRQTCCCVRNVLKAFHFTPIDLVWERKFILDGSNRSCFQRTARIGLNGYVDLDGRRILLPEIRLEEDSCTKLDCIWSTARHGLPLLEVVSEPVVEPEVGLITALLKHIGVTIRMYTDHGGIGTVRQDLNVSTCHTTRCELKGVQDIKNVEKVLQIQLKRHREGPVAPEVRVVAEDGTSRPLRQISGDTRYQVETECPPQRAFDLSTAQTSHIFLDAITDPCLRATVLQTRSVRQALRTMLCSNATAETLIGAFNRFGTEGVRFFSERLRSNVWSCGQIKEILRREKKLSFEENLYEKLSAQECRRLSVSYTDLRKLFSDYRHRIDSYKWLLHILQENDDHSKSA